MEVKNPPRGRIPPELLQKIKDATNIVEIIGEHVVLRKAGSNYRGLCPFHKERTPSFDVSEGKQLYHCKGCGKGGDPVRFLQELYGMSFPEAVEELAERARIPLPTGWEGSNSDDPEVRKRREAAREKASTSYRLNYFVAKFYHTVLEQLPEAQAYFHRRGVSPDLVRNFYVGIAPASWDALANHLLDKKAPLPLAAELGLIRPSQKGASVSRSGYFDLFRNRAMFPIMDIRGKIVGFGGRTLPAGIASAASAASGGGEEGPKYMNSTDSALFQKSKVVFGLYQAQKHIREKDEVILVEGYFDVVALHAAGFQNAVATCGTSLTPDHLAIFRRFASKVTVLFDGDKAGVTATERAMEIGLQHGMILHGAVMPTGLDPDEVLFDQTTGSPTPDGVARMQEILEKAQPLLDTRLGDAIRYGEQGPEQRTQALKRIGKWLAEYQDPVGREVRLQHVETKMGINRALLEQAMHATKGGGSPTGSAGSGAVPRPGGGAGRSPSLPTPNPSPNPAAAPGMVPQRHPNSPSPPPARQKTAAARRLARSEQILLAALVRTHENGTQFTQAAQNLPAHFPLEGLFEHPAASAFVQSLPKDISSVAEFERAVRERLDQEQDPQIRTLIMEALMASEPPYSREEVRTALGRATSRAWARFSQQIKAAIAAAEAKKDAGLEAELKKEYLDVQRKMKEFSSFYDEA